MGFLYPNIYIGARGQPFAVYRYTAPSPRPAPLAEVYSIQRYTAGLQYTALQRSTVYSSIHSPSAASELRPRLRSFGPSLRLRLGPRYASTSLHLAPPRRSPASASASALAPPPPRSVAPSLRRPAASVARRCTVAAFGRFVVKVRFYASGRSGL